MCKDVLVGVLGLRVGIVFVVLMGGEEKRGEEGWRETFGPYEILDSRY